MEQIIIYGKEDDSVTKETKDIIEKTKHFADSAKKLGCYIEDEDGGGHYKWFRALSTEYQLEIELNRDRDVKSYGAQIN